MLVDMQKSVVWLLANLAFMNRSTLLLEVTTGKAVGAQVVCLQYGYLLVVRERLEFGASVEGMLLGFADDAIAGGSSVGGEGSDFA